MDQQFSEKENLEKHQVDYTTAFELGNIPVMHMTFGSEEEAYEYYNSYARAVGFSIRRHYKYKREKDEKIVWRILCCSCQGLREKHQNGTPNKPRPQTRFNCQARMKIKLTENEENYVVTELVAQHTHVLAPPDKAHMLRSHRCIRPAQEGLINSMTDAGIAASDIYHYCAQELGGYDKMNFSHADLDNIVQKRRTEFLKRGDGILLLDYFRQKKKENDSFYYAIQVDADNQIRNCFWCDAKSRIDYECFGDVVSFDTTYKTNNYDMPFAPFVGVNHHRQTIIFASALLSDETTETFVWVFEQFLHAMGGKAMKTIFSDQAMAICNAIKQVFPDAHHRLCIWHIHQNALRNLSHVFTKFKSFNDDFMHCIYEAEAEEEFLSHWEELLQKYDLKEEKWLKTLFEKKEKWAQVYGRQHFCAGMASTQRSESMNNYFKKYFKRKQILREFMKQFDKAISLRRLKEADADLKSTQSMPNLLSKWVVERLARDFYPRKMFSRFQTELNAFVDLGVNNPPITDDSSMITYEVESYNTGRVRRVGFIRSENTVTCSCQMFEFTGMPCAHMLKVWRINNVKVVPSQYFLKRWSKDANPTEITDPTGNTIKVDCNVPLSERFSELSHMAQTVVTTGSLTDTLTEVAKKWLQRAIEEVEACRKTIQEDAPTDANNADPSLVVEGSGDANNADPSLVVEGSGDANNVDPSLVVQGSGDANNADSSLAVQVSGDTNNADSSLAVQGNGDANNADPSLAVQGSGDANNIDPNRVIQGTGGQFDDNIIVFAPQRKKSKGKQSGRIKGFYDRMKKNRACQRRTSADKKGQEDVTDTIDKGEPTKSQPKKRHDAGKKGLGDMEETQGNSQAAKPQPRKRSAGKRGPQDLAEIQRNSQVAKPQPKKRSAGKKGPQDPAEILENSQVAKPQPKTRSAGKKRPGGLGDVDRTNQATKPQPRKRGKKGSGNDANKVDISMEKTSLEKPSIQNDGAVDVDNFSELPYTQISNHSAPVPTHGRMDRSLEDDYGNPQVPFSFRQFLADQCAIPLDNGGTQAPFSYPQPPNAI